MQELLRRLNVVGECRKFQLGPWECPPLLFLVLGCINIAVMLGSYTLATRYVDDPEIAALIVIAISTIIFVVGIFIIQGFERIAEANRIKSEFIAIVSHQLRSPLSVFKWTVEALAHSRGAAAASSEPSIGVRGVDNPHLVVLQENTEKMIQLVNMLLDVSRIEAGRLILKVEPVRLNLITEEIVRGYQAYARASNLTLEFISPQDIAPVSGDREKITMVVQNLVDNAIRYSKGGSRIVITITPNARGLEWKIQDTGIGIPQAEQRFVFQKFFRSIRASEHTTDGSGLGLYIARSIIAAEGGDIGFSSREGQGSTFWFRLPAYKNIEAT